jgi:Nucleotidyl transferase AbiEii toxin, Type IV TA system
VLSSRLDPARYVLKGSANLRYFFATIHRWKIGIQAPGSSALVRSKVEFSNRDGEGDYTLASLPDAVVEPYALRPPSVQHYDAAAATMQKVAALAGRPQTQARDVFDLELLLRRQPLVKGSLDPA